MFTVNDIAPDAKRILANCDNATLLNRLNYAVESLANESDWDPLVGVVDINTTTTPASPQSAVVTLPREIETPLSVNIGTSPATPRNRYFSFHLNGPGDEENCSCDYAWDDKGDYPTVVDLSANSQLIAIAEDAADVTIELWAYGYDASNQWIRTLQAGTWYDGAPVTVSANPAATPGMGAQVFSRITRVRKDVSQGYVKLYGYASGTPTLLGDYAPTETEPSYRRIRVSRNCGWVRVIFRRRVFKLEAMTDLIPLHSPFALLMALKALQKMEDDQIDEGEKYWNRALDFITKEQLSRNPVTTPEIQVKGPRVFAFKDRLE